MGREKNALQTQWESDEQRWNKEKTALQSQWKSDEKRWNKEKTALQKQWEDIKKKEEEKRKKKELEDKIKNMSPTVKYSKRYWGVTRGRKPKKNATETDCKNWASQNGNWKRTITVSYLPVGCIAFRNRVWYNKRNNTQKCGRYQFGCVERNDNPFSFS